MQAESRPRGAADPARASRHGLNRNGETSHHRPIGPNTPALPVPRKGMEKAGQTLRLMT